MADGTVYRVLSAEPAGGPTPDAETADDFRLSDVTKLARRARQRVIATARADDRITFRSLIVEHLQHEPTELDIVLESWPMYDHVNVQRGIDAWTEQPGRTHRLIGVVANRHSEVSLADMMRAPGRMMMGHMPGMGNVARVSLPAGPAGEVQASVVCGLYLLGDGARHAVMLLRMGLAERGEPDTRVEIAADDPAFAAEIGADVRAFALERNVYRGQVVSFTHDMFGQRGSMLSFHVRPDMRVDDLILPTDTIDAIVRQVVGVARHRGRLLAAGQHLKRGLLLYGPPGVGKTHTVRYLMSQLTDLTIVMLSGDALRMIGPACSVARSLQPAMVVVEDVDLIAEERGRHPGENPMLFELLNEMDGLAEDADVVCLLTTNRADVLEPALAQRPCRVDQAVALEMPDRDARRKLFHLYRAGLIVDESGLEEVLDRTEGVTASFLKELLRRAAVRAADDDVDGPISVDAPTLSAALDDLLDTRNAMTRVLLGGGSDVAEPMPHAGVDRRARPGLAPS